VHKIVGWIEESSQGVFEFTDIKTRDDQFFEKIKMSRDSFMDFRGFDETFLKLEVSSQKRRVNG
jgi:hypothetical protein